MMAPGGKAQRLRLADMPTVYRLLGECGELWAHGPAWRDHLCRGMAKLLGASAATYMELCVAPDGAPRHVDAATITGLDDAERVHFDRAVRDIGSGRIQPVGHGHLMGQLARRGAGVAERRAYAPDRVWYGSRYFQEYRRLGGVDHNVVTLRPIEPGRLCILEAEQRLGAPPLGERALKLMALLSAELTARLGAPLVTEQHLGLHGLSPRLEQTLRALLRGKRPKQIAEDLGISLYTVRQYVADLHCRFEVRTNGELLAYFLKRRPRRRPQP